MLNRLPLFLTPTVYLYAVGLSAFGFTIATWSEPSPLTLIQDYGLYFFLGLCGALVANATGAGGGVIFIPFFATLGLSHDQSVATSMAIQCFGMTAGSISWITFLRAKIHSGEISKTPTQHIAKVAIGFTVAGMLAGQYLLPSPQLPIEMMFGVFSVAFGFILFTFNLAKGRNFKGILQPPSKTHRYLIAITCLLGGIVTAWLSVGVGEAIALLLFFLGYPVFFAVAMGVITSSVAVLVGIGYHIAYGNIVIEVMLFAGMAAFIGGYVARFITNKIGAFNLKIFFAGWIFLSGLYSALWI